MTHQVSPLSVTSLKGKNRLMRAFVFVHIIEGVSKAHSQNVPLEWFSSTTRLGVVPKAVERNLLVAYPVIDIRGDS